MSQKCVIYARYSSDNQTENSIEGQVRECTEFAERNGYTVLKIYADRATTGKNDDRPQFQQMLKDGEKKLFDAVIIWKLDRFARNRYDSAINKNHLKKNGIKVLSATENITDSPEGVLMESVLEGYAEYFSLELAVKVNRGMTENALKSKFNGGAGTFGYYIDENKHFQPDIRTAPIVTEIFNKYLNGEKIKQIVDWLGNAGIKSVHGKTMEIDAVTRILKNRRYLGEYRFKDVVNVGAIPPLVTPEVFDEAQKRLEKNKKAPSRFKALEEHYLLTTKLFCGKCSNPMSGESGRSSNGKSHRYYKCSIAKKRKGCDKKTIRKADLEDIVIKNIMQLLFDDELVNRIVNAVYALQGEENTELIILQKQLAEIEKSINNMLNAIQDGVYTSSTKQRLEELEQTKSNIELSILQQQVEKSTLSKEQISLWLRRFRETDIDDWEQKQKLVEVFINSIYVYEDKVVIAFNMEKGERTITLAEVETAVSSAGSVTTACSTVTGFAVPVKKTAKAFNVKAFAVFHSRNCFPNLYHLSPSETAFFRLICSIFAVLFQVRNYPTDLR